MPTISALLRGYRGDTLSLFRMSSAALTTKVVTRTPVLFGSLRASWAPSNGQPITNNVTITHQTESYQPQRNAITQVINSLQLGDVYSLGNGQPYVRKVEYEGHSSMKAPAGMLGISVAEFDGMVRRIIENGR
jgi:hypothetical protein